jgi:hypothetical protein
MNPNGENLTKERKEALLNLLKLAAGPLRVSLRRQPDPLARSHLERAIAHLHEATVAISEPWRARTVTLLLTDMAAIDTFRDELQRQPPPGVTIKPIRP